MKQLIFKNEKQAAQIVVQLKTAANLIQKVYDEFINYSPIFNVNDLGHLMAILREPDTYLKASGIDAIRPIVENYLKESILASESSFKIGQVNISKDKLKDLIELGDISGLVDAISNLLGPSIIAGYGTIDLSDFEVKKGVICLCSGAADRVAERHSYFAVNNRQLSAFNAVKAACTALNEFKATLSGLSVEIYANEFFSFPVSTFKLITLEGGVYSPNYHVISNL